MNRTLILAAVLIAALPLLAACGGREGPVATETALEHAEKHLDASYQCPMHPEVTSDAPGRCPICGMDLVKTASAQPGPRNPLFYRHPHDPSVTSPVPRKDEMGMDFVPVYAAPGDDDGSVLLSPAMVNNLGVRTAPARRGTLPAAIEIVTRSDCPAKQCQILGDRNQLQQVLVNLANNAAEAMPTGGRLTIALSAGQGVDADPTSPTIAWLLV